MTLTDLEVAVSRTTRNYGYVREQLLRIWTPGGGRRQQGYSRELAGALFLESDEYFDRALVLFLLRQRIRRIYSPTWAAVATYYSNYFAATSFIRLNMRAVAHVRDGPPFDVSPVDYNSFFFSVSQRKRRLGHEEIWRIYYDLIAEMAWPDPATAMMLAPTVEALRFREQKFREKVNYRIGEGFKEMYLSPAKLTRELERLLKIGDRGKPVEGLDDEEYNDRLAVERLAHLGQLLGRLRAARNDPVIELERQRLRMQLVNRYADGPTERTFALSLLS